MTVLYTRLYTTTIDPLRPPTWYRDFQGWYRQERTRPEFPANILYLRDHEHLKPLCVHDQSDTVFRVHPGMNRLASILVRPQPSSVSIQMYTPDPAQTEIPCEWHSTDTWHRSCYTDDEEIAIRTEDHEWKQLAERYLLRTYGRIYPRDLPHKWHNLRSHLPPKPQSGPREKHT